MHRLSLLNTAEVKGLIIGCSSDPVCLCDKSGFNVYMSCCSPQTAVFTPAYGSVTNVRINSCMTTPQVLRVLLNKFKIENSPDDFAIYLVHTSGGESTRHCVCMCV